MEVMNDTESVLQKRSEPRYGSLRLARPAQPEAVPGKRALDVLLASVGLLVASPVLLVIALLIKLENPKAPILFKQVRIGKDGVPFKMYKFRSMVPDAEALLAKLAARNEASGAMFKMKHDPRVTRIGRLLRRTSLDELPQLWNVLKGEMSLVGPRPPLPREVALYSEYEMRRLSVIPGCTGLWQVSGRSSVGFEQMVELDLKYIQNRGLWLDIKIILRTVKLVFGSKDAY